MVKNGIANQACATLLGFHNIAMVKMVAATESNKESRGQDLCAAAAAARLIFKTSTREQSVDPEVADLR